MKSKHDTKAEAHKLVRGIKPAPRRTFSAEEKIRIVLAGLRGEDRIAELCRREGLHQNLYYRWSKEFLEAVKKRLAVDTEREASREIVRELRKESAQLKAALVETMLDNRLLKKACSGLGRTLYEICRRQKAGDHSHGRRSFAGHQTDAGAAGHSQVNLLQLV